MRKIIIIIFSLLVLSFSFQTVFSQEKEFDYNRAYQDYAYTYNQYRDSYNKYDVAKSQYLTYKTLTAENNALVATKEMLEKRSEVLRTYLTALRLKLAESTQAIGYQANNLYLQLDSEVNWLVKYRDLPSSASTIEDLLKTSAEFEQRYPSTKVIIYQTLGEIIKSKEVKLYQTTLNLISETEEKIHEIKKGDSSKALVWERWLLEAKNKAIRSSEKQDYAEKILKTLRPGDEAREDFYQAQFALKESNQYLKEAVFYLKEIIQKIKYD